MVGKEKGRSESGLFCFHLIDSGYQVGRIRLPNILGGFGGEVVWNQCALLWCGGRGLDRFLRGPRATPYSASLGRCGAPI